MSKPGVGWPLLWSAFWSRLANMLKGRDPEVPSQIPEGAEISQAA